MTNHYIAIMAGGIGSRFWPSSTEIRPKQFLDILGTGQSLIRSTFERCLHLVPAERMLIVTNIRYKALVMEHLPELPERNILCEPSMNNTAPCVAYTALHIRSLNPKATFAVLPSDHVILKEKAYVARMSEAFDYASNHEAIVTLGIQPTRPDTGYGYIETGEKVNAEDLSADAKILKVASFREKPYLEKAKEYLRAGNYLWNAGMFVWSVETILKAYEKYASGILESLCINDEMFGTEDEQEYINTVYPHTESISVDYAILEKADNVYTIPADIGWSDLGTWSSLHDFQEKDENGCVVSGADIHLIDTKDSLVRAPEGKLVVIKGLEDYIVVDEEEALLIYPKKLEQEIKQVVSQLPARG